MRLKKRNFNRELKISVCEEIEHGLNKYPFLREVRFFDDTLAFNKKWFREFAEKYKNKILSLKKH